MANPRGKNSGTMGKNIIIVLLLIVIGFTAYRFVVVAPATVTTTEMTLKEKGINTNKVTIRAVAVESSWEYNHIAYEIKNIYLTPDIADIGNWRDNFNIGTKNQFVVVEADVRDERISGERQNIDTTSFLRIKVGDVESAPKDDDSLFLSPQEDGKVFRVFVVDKSIQEVTLLSGIASRPRVTKINFFNGDARILYGVFLLKSGFSAKYSKE